MDDVRKAGVAKGRRHGVTSIINAPRNASAITRLMRPRRNNWQAAVVRLRRDFLKSGRSTRQAGGASSVCPALRSRWTSNANRAARGNSRAHSTMKCSARGVEIAVTKRRRIDGVEELTEFGDADLDNPAFGRNGDCPQDEHARDI